MAVAQLAPVDAPDWELGDAVALRHRLPKPPKNKRKRKSLGSQVNNAPLDRSTVILEEFPLIQNWRTTYKMPQGWTANMYHFRPALDHKSIFAGDRIAGGSRSSTKRANMFLFGRGTHDHPDDYSSIEANEPRRLLSNERILGNVAQHSLMA